MRDKWQDWTCANSRAVYLLGFQVLRSVCCLPRRVPWSFNIPTTLLRRWLLDIGYLYTRVLEWYDSGDYMYGSTCIRLRSYCFRSSASQRSNIALARFTRGTQTLQQPVDWHDRVDHRSRSGTHTAALCRMPHTAHTTPLCTTDGSWCGCGHLMHAWQAHLLSTGRCAAALPRRAGQCAVRLEPGTHHSSRRRAPPRRATHPALRRPPTTSKSTQTPKA